MLLTPFNVFNNIVWASRLFPDFVGWSTLGAIMVIANFAVAISLDANFLEAADRISQRMTGWIWRRIMATEYGNRRNLH